MTDKKIDKGTVVTHIFIGGDMLHVVGSRDEVKKAILTGDPTPWRILQVVNHDLEIEEILVNTSLIFAIGVSHEWDPPSVPSFLGSPEDFEKLVRGGEGTPSASL